MIKRNLCFGLAAAFVLFLNTRALDAGIFNKKSHKSREQVSPACHPTFGYHQTRWRRFPSLPPCDDCNTCPAGTCQTGSSQTGSCRNDNCPASVHQPQPVTASSAGWPSPTQGGRCLVPSTSSMRASPSPQTAHPVPYSSGEPPYSSMPASPPAVSPAAPPTLPAPSAAPAAAPPVPPVPSKGAQSQTFFPTQAATSAIGAERSRMTARPTRPAPVHPQAAARQMTSTSLGGPSRTPSNGRYRMIGAPAQHVPVHTRPMPSPGPSNPSGLSGFGDATLERQRWISTPLLRLPAPQPQT